MRNFTKSSHNVVRVIKNQILTCKVVKLKNIGL